MNLTPTPPPPRALSFLFHATKQIHILFPVSFYLGLLGGEREKTIKRKEREKKLRERKQKHQTNQKNEKVGDHPTNTHTHTLTLILESFFYHNRRAFAAKTK